MLNPHPKLRHWEYILLKVQQKINRISWIIAVLFFGHLSGEFGHRSHYNSRISTPHGRLCPRKPYRSCSSGFSRRWRWQPSPNEFKHSSQPESFINRVIMGINIVLNACITSNRALVFCFDPSNPVQRFGVGALTDFAYSPVKVCQKLNRSSTDRLAEWMDTNQYQQDRTSKMSDQPSWSRVCVTDEDKAGYEPHK